MIECEHVSITLYDTEEGSSIKTSPICVHTFTFLYRRDHFQCELTLRKEASMLRPLIHALHRRPKSPRVRIGTSTLRNTTSQSILLHTILVTNFVSLFSMMETVQDFCSRTNFLRTIGSRDTMLDLGRWKLDFPICLRRILVCYLMI